MTTDEKLDATHEMFAASQKRMLEILGEPELKTERCAAYLTFAAGNALVAFRDLLEATVSAQAGDYTGWEADHAQAELRRLHKHLKVAEEWWQNS